MIDYIKSVLPRIKQFSKELNEIANFVDIPWGFIDDDGDKVTYLFRRNNELLFSKRGDVASGRWEYLPMMQSLLIEHNGKKRMYNQGFLDKAIMVLRKDSTDELLPLVNNQLIPDMNIVEYLERKILPQTYLGKMNDTNEKTDIEIVENEVLLLNGDAIIIVGRKDKSYFGKKILRKKDRLPLVDGNYVLANKDKISVKNGRVTGISSFIDEQLAWGCQIFLGLILIVLLIVIMVQNMS